MGEKNCREWSGSLGFNPSGDDRVGGGGDASALGDGVGDTRPLEKIVRS